MSPPFPYLRRCLLSCVCGLAASAPSLPAQTAPQSATAVPSGSPRPAAPSRNSIFLDPAHGGDDLGAALPEGTTEKDVTLALVDRIRLQLSSFNIPVLLARDADPTTGSPSSAPSPTPDQRAGLANHAHPLACLVVHATAAGHGIHVITADLPAPDAPANPEHPGLTPWLSAQAASLPLSDRLASALTSSLSRAGLPVHRFRANLSPLSSLTCPAVVLELAPLSRSQSPANAAYQGRTAQAVATALLFFRGELLPATSDSPTAQPPAQPPTQPAAQP